MNATESLFDTMRGTKPIRVRILTTTLALTGAIHLPNTGKDSRQLTQFLQSSKGFVAMTDVQMRERGQIDAPLETLRFIQINVERIEMIEPLE
jgi:hypothetical protein